MNRIGSEDYAVIRADFPITIEIEAFDLVVFQGESSPVVATKPDGTLLTSFGFPLQPVADKPMLRRCELPDPGGTETVPAKRYEPPSDLIFTLVIGYDTRNGADPRYEVRMKSASGDMDTRTFRPPDRGITTNLTYR